MSWMGSTSQVTSCDLFIHETSKGVGVSRECPGHWPGNCSNLSCDTRARLGKGWKAWGNPYSRVGVWRFIPSFHVDIVVHLCRVLKAWSLSGRNHSVVLTFYTHGSVDDGLWALWLYDDTFTSMSSIAWHTLNEHHYFPHSYKYPITTLCIHQIL